MYLPSRSGCTDAFKESLDYLDSLLGLLAFDNDVTVIGDANADPGPSGGRKNPVMLPTQMELSLPIFKSPPLQTPSTMKVKPMEHSVP